MSRSALAPGPAAPMAWQTAAWIARPGPFMERRRTRYGDAFTIRLPATGTCVFVSDPDTIKQVLHVAAVRRRRAALPRAPLARAGARARRARSHDFARLVFGRSVLTSRIWSSATVRMMRRAGPLPDTIVT
jgi:hypothetical protein